MSPLKNLIYIACLAAIFAPASPALDPPLGSAPEGGVRGRAFETSDFMLSSAYRDVPHLYTDSAPDGAYGPVNRAWDARHKGEWYTAENGLGGVGAGGAPPRNVRVT